MFQNVGAQAYKPGLERVLTLSSHFGNPHKGIKTIHVAGTNGKGSVSSLLASVLQESGQKTALFTSPHLVDFRERIRIDGRMISKEAVIDFIERFKSLNTSVEPSFFELTTVMAFDWFAKNNVDIAVIEVGLGGRLDSTNIITPLQSIITNISLDHTALLGDTPEHIAREKAGIIKPGVPVVIGNANKDVERVFVSTAKEAGAEIVFAQNQSPFSSVIRQSDKLIFKDTVWGDIESPLTGDCQLENAATVLTALSKGPFKFDEIAVRNGFKNVCLNTGLTGRWTTLRQKPTVVCDTGHNPGGWEWLGPQLKKISQEKRLHIVAGFVNDKDISSILSMMPTEASFYWATPSVKRGLNAQITRERALSYGLNGKAFQHVSSAYNSAISEASENDFIFVGGSNFVVADLLSAINQRQ